MKTDFSCSGGRGVEMVGKERKNLDRSDWISKEKKTTVVQVLMMLWALSYLVLWPSRHLCICHLSAVRLPQSLLSITLGSLLTDSPESVARWSYCLLKWFRLPLPQGFSTQILQLPAIPPNDLFLAKYIPYHSSCLILSISLFYCSCVQVFTCMER